MVTQITKIPEGWEKITLGEKIDILTDYHANGSYEVLKKNVQLLDNPDYAIMIRTTNFENGDFKNNLKYINKHAYEFLEKSKVLPNDILMNKIANAGSVYLMPNLSKPVSLAMNLFLIRMNDSVDQRFVYYHLKGMETLIKKYCAGSVTKTITKENVRLLPVVLPSIKEQKSIVSILSCLDDKIELLRQQNETLETIAQAIYKEWFVKFRFPEGSGKMIASELGEIPEGWRVGKIKDLIDILSGFAFSSSNFSQNGRYKLVTIKNVQDRHFNSDTKDKLAELPEKMPDYCKLDSGDILLSLTGNVGRICLVNGNDYLLNQRVAKLKAKNSVDYAFSYLLFLQDSIFSLLQSTASGTAQQNLSPIQTKEIEIVIADRKTLDIFGSFANKLIQKMNKNNSQIHTLSVLRDTLLPKLMKGELRVKRFGG
jgi:type I restriction enzyme S subunit